MGILFDAIKKLFKRQGREIEQPQYKQSSGRDLELLKTTYVGWDPIRINKQLEIRKRRSQQKNWSKWKKRLRK